MTLNGDDIASIAKVKFDNRRTIGQTAFKVILVTCVLGYLTTYGDQGLRFKAIFHVSTWVALCSLAGFWAGLGRFPLRIPAVVATAIVTAVVSNEFKVEGLLLYVAFSLGLVLVVGVTSFALRIMHGELQQAKHDSQNKDSLQFGVRDLLVWTTSIAGALAVGRWLISNQGNAGLDAIFTVAGLLGTLVITCVAAIWALLGQSISATRLVSFLVILCLATLVNNILVSGNLFWLITTPLSQIPIVAAIYCLRLQDYRFVRTA